MNHKLLTALTGLGICGALLAAGLMLPVRADPRVDPREASPLVETLETGAAEAVAPAERKQVRRRGTLSMPYFSFAQSLRPRG